MILNNLSKVKLFHISKGNIGKFKESIDRYY